MKNNFRNKNLRSIGLLLFLATSSGSLMSMKGKTVEVSPVTAHSETVAQGPSLAQKAWQGVPDISKQLSRAGTALSVPNMGFFPNARAKLASEARSATSHDTGIEMTDRSQTKVLLTGQPFNILGDNPVQSPTVDTQIAADQLLISKNSSERNAATTAVVTQIATEVGLPTAQNNSKINAFIASVSQSASKSIDSIMGSRTADNGTTITRIQQVLDGAKLMFTRLADGLRQSAKQTASTNLDANPAAVDLSATSADNVDLSATSAASETYQGSNLKSNPNNQLVIMPDQGVRDLSVSLNTTELNKNSVLQGRALFRY